MPRNYLPNPMIHLEVQSLLSDKLYKRYNPKLREPEKRYIPYPDTCIS